MTRAAPIVTSFNAGELSPMLDGRVDIAKYAAGGKRVENFLLTVQGPAVRRGGFRFVQAIKNEANRSWLIKFEFSATQFFVLEFGNAYVRFYTDHGVLLSGLSPYEIVSPYTVADLTMPDGTCALSVVQSGDVLYIANKYRTYKTRKLTRTSDTSWAFSTYDPNQGPFLEQNSSAVTLQASAATGSVTLTASAATFVASDVGRLVRLQSQDVTTKPWETNKAYTTNALVRYDGKTYIATNTKTSGTAPPTHLEGSAFDGQDGVDWYYQNAGYGVLRITAFTSSTQVTASVVVDEPNGLYLLPAEVVATPSKRWALGAWSDTTEYPGNLTFFRSRLVLAGEFRYWLSVPEDFENHAPDFYGEQRFDNAFSKILTSQDLNEIQWIVGADKLVIGTGGGEFVGGEITTSEPLGPTNFEALPQPPRRSRSVRPTIIGAAICYVQRAGRKLLGLTYSFEQDRYVSNDLAVLADRVTRSGIIDMAYQGEPYSINWAVLSNGGLRAFTFDQEQDVQGWGRHPVGGTDAAVESVVCGPTPDGGREELWAIVRRTIDGDTHRYVEYLERPWEGDDEDGTPGDDQEDAFYVDSGLTYEGVSTATITGLDHLEGETVQVLADGARQPDKVVSSGAITLTRAASVVHVGLQYVSRLVPMRIEAGANLGTAQGKLKRVHKVILRFIDTLGGKIGRYGEQLDDLSLRDPETPMGQAPPITSGDDEVTFGGDYDRDALVEIVQDEPLPMTVAAMIPELRVYE
jgi:hypothetical protein